MKNVLSLVSFGFLALISTVASAPTASASAGSATPARYCVHLQIPVHVVTTNTHYNQPRVDSNLDAIDWTVKTTTWNFNWTVQANGTKHVDEIFGINAQLCVPSQKTKKSSILQIATAGQGFDKRYFDVEINPSEYSYVDAAVAKGYSILTYDRLGTGASDKPNAYDVVQIPTDVEILAGLTKMARSGEIISSATVLNGSLVSDFIPTKIVHVGHAYGSYMGTFMLAKYGDLVDGALLTGLLFNNQLKDNPITVLTYNHAFPREVNPILFADYGSGYFILDSEETLQKLFFQKATLDPALLAYAESIKQPETVGQYATEDALEIPSTAANYTGPILFFNGEYDNYVCNGDCNGVQYQDQTEYIYGNATDQFSFYLQPNTGHATGLSMNASAGYEVMLQFLDSRGL